MEHTVPKGGTKKPAGSKDTKKKGEKKQISIATMLKPPPAKAPKKKKQDLLVRITNKAGFGGYAVRSFLTSADMVCRIWPTTSRCRSVGFKAARPRFVSYASL